MRFVSSRRHIVGSLLALAGICVYLAGIFDQYWLVIMIALYVVGYFATPKSPLAQRGTTNAQSPEAIAKFLDTFVEQIRHRVEPPVLARVLSIVGSINGVLPVLAGGTMQVDGTSLSVRQIATEYLPTALDAYLRIPPAERSRRPRVDQHTAQESLHQELVLIDARMRDIVRSVQRNDLQSLLDNGRSLRNQLTAPASS